MPFVSNWSAVKHRGNGFMVRARISLTGVVKLEYLESNDYMDSYTTDQVELMREWLGMRIPEADVEIILNKIQAHDNFQN
jgi:hypothetical protein